MFLIKAYIAPEFNLESNDIRTLETLSDVSQHAYVDLQKEPNMFLQLTTTDESAEQAYRMEGLNAYIDNTV